MKVGFWNCEGLSHDRVNSIIDYCDGNEMDAIVLVETWRKPSQVINNRKGWTQFDTIVEQRQRANASRGYGGISLICRDSRRVTCRYTCPDECAALWTIDDTLVAGCYYAPSAPDSIYQRSIRGLMAAVREQQGDTIGATIVGGDFNSRLGTLTGDNKTHKERAKHLMNATQLASLTLLNAHLATSDHRWTWVHERERSIPDLAFATLTARAHLSVHKPPGRASHQMLHVQIQESKLDELPTERWNWSRRRLVNPSHRTMIRDIMQPYLAMLTHVWTGLQTDLTDDQVWNQEAIDDLYELTMASLRMAVHNFACWTPKEAKRKPKHYPEMDLDKLDAMPVGQFMQALKRKLDAHNASAGDGPSDPELSEFHHFYSELYQGAHGPPPEVIAPVRTSLTQIEEQAISPNCIAKRLRKATAFKAMGPDNMPIELLTGTPGEAALMLSAMYRCFMLCQLTPSVFRHGRTAMIPKPGKDRSDVESWRGLAMTSHLRKDYEKSVAAVLYALKLTKVHDLQFGFQRGRGCPDSIYVMQELSRAMKHRGRPMGVISLDIRKAYDTVDRTILWDKLRALGAELHTVAIVRSLFDNCQVVFTRNDIDSEPVRMDRGLMQGAVLSPTLFNLMIDDLLGELDEAAGNGCVSMYGQRYPATFFADDQTLLYTDYGTAQRMLDTCHDYSVRHRYEYNVDKCLNVRANPYDKRRLHLGDRTVPNVNSTSLLGVACVNGKFPAMVQTKDRIGRAKRTLNMLSTTGVIGSDKLTMTKRKAILQTWVNSRYEYGLAFGELHPGSIAALNSFMKVAAGKVFSTSKGTAAMQRYLGLANAKTRSSWLRTRYLDKMATAGRTTTAGRLFRSAKNTKGTLAAAWTNDPLWRQYSQRVARIDPDDPHRPSKRLVLNNIMEREAWSGPESQMKLVALQQHSWNDPHPIAYCKGQSADRCAKWIVGRWPGTLQSCSSCNGARLTSRYHVSRCAKAVTLLADHINTSEHIRMLNQYDNAIDYVIGTRIHRVSRGVRRRHPQLRQWTTEINQQLADKVGHVLESVKLTCFPNRKTPTSSS
jgi:hypothetical protein